MREEGAERVKRKRKYSLSVCLPVAEGWFNPHTSPPRLSSPLRQQPCVLSTRIYFEVHAISFFQMEWATHSISSPWKPGTGSGRSKKAVSDFKGDEKSVLFTSIKFGVSYEDPTHHLKLLDKWSVADPLAQYTHMQKISQWQSLIFGGILFSRYFWTIHVFVSRMSRSVCEVCSRCCHFGQTWGRTSWRRKSLDCLVICRPYDCMNVWNMWHMCSAVRQTDASTSIQRETVNYAGYVNQWNRFETVSLIHFVISDSNYVVASWECFTFSLPWIMIQRDLISGIIIEAGWFCFCCVWQSGRWMKRLGDRLEWSISVWMSELFTE